MSKFIITHGYVPESVNDRFNAHDITSLPLGWLRLVVPMGQRKNKDTYSGIGPFITIGIVPLGVEHSGGMRGPNKPEAEVRFAGVVALSNNILRVEGEHYRSGQKFGSLSAEKASPDDYERYSDLIQIGDALNDDSLNLGPRTAKRMSRLEVVEQASRQIVSDVNTA